jgi:hypothetical protein
MATATAMGTPGGGSYPVTFDVEYDQEQNRWLVFVRWLFAIPHIIILYALGIASAVITFVAFFAILFTKKYPPGLFAFVVNVNRWSANVSAYELMLRDEYPPFSWDAGQYAVTYDVQYPEELSRWMPLVKWLLAFPHYLVLFLLYVGAVFALIVAWFAILFTTRMPEAIHKYLVGVMRWTQRVNAYTNLMRDEYPPFSMEP